MDGATSHQLFAFEGLSRIERQGHHSNLFISNFLTYNSQSLWCEIRRSEFGTRNPLTFQMMKYEFHHLFLLKNLVVSQMLGAT